MFCLRLYLLWISLYCYQCFEKQYISLQDACDGASTCNIRPSGVFPEEKHLKCCFVIRGTYQYEANGQQYININKITFDRLTDSDVNINVFPNLETLEILSLAFDSLRLCEHLADTPPHCVMVVAVEDKRQQLCVSFSNCVYVILFFCLLVMFIVV